MKIGSRTHLLLLLSVAFHLTGRSHKVYITGDTLLEEGSETQYQVAVKNTGTADQTDLVITFDGFCLSGLTCCSVYSEDLKVSANMLSEKQHIEAFTQHFPAGKTVTLIVTAKAAVLQMAGDLARATLTAKAEAQNIKRKGKAKMSVSLFKAQ